MDKKPIIIISCIILVFVMIYNIGIKKYIFFGATSLTSQEIAAIDERINEINYDNSDDHIPGFLYPQYVGKDTRNGEELEIRYHCGDVCPNYGNLKMVYKYIKDRQTCENIGGVAVEAGVPAVPGTFMYCTTQLP